MKAPLVIVLVLSAPCYAVDIGKLFSNPKIAEQLIPLMEQQAQKDRSCAVLLNPTTRLQQWQLDLRTMQGLMQIAQPLNASTTIDTNALSSQTETIKLSNQIQTLKLIVNQSQECLLKSINWADICNNSHPTIASQCSANIDFVQWLNQEWQCENKTELCSQKLTQLQTAQLSSRQLAEWAIDSASNNNPTLDRATWRQLLGFEAAKSQ
ncbi:hypothetical protein NT239_13675 [Chitinibacter sp. SCUT-21]|uniref:hypothetical protein n=1 Tax=Chitinibacter sp. SCUT-21 TaxID=2970891 RepID=UPI0035A5A311